MRFMVMVKADKSSEAGVLPDEKLLAAMGKYNEELVKAGVLLAAEGLQPSSKGARVRFSGEKRTVMDGPFSETKELVAGFWLIQVKSKEEAIEWVKRCPNPFPGTESEIEIRQVFEADDFGPALTPELRVISVLASLMFLMSAAMKLKGGPELAEGMAHVGLPESMVVPLAILEISCVVIYLIPPTSVLGAILLAGYVGGAICTHWRVGDPFFVQIVLGIFVWLGLYLREDRLRALIPLRAR